jgi:hypothetical protein
VSYTNTFIRVAADCPTPAAEVPPRRTQPSVAELQHRVLAEHPYELTEEQLYVRVHGLRKGLSEQEIGEHQDALHAEVFAKPQACLRASPLTKRYGFGAHYDADGRIALHPREQSSYVRLSDDPTLTQLRAMRSARR